MVVANMSKAMSDVEARLYLCPTKEEDFELGHVHHPAKYLACYVGGGPKYVAEVAACVRVGKTKPSEVLWKFTDASDEDLIAKAKESLKTTENTNRLPPRLVFLLENLSRTDFQYDLSGGMQSSRIYFDVTEIEPTDIKDLAQKLTRIRWSELAKWKPK